MVRSRPRLTLTMVGFLHPVRVPLCPVEKKKTWLLFAGDACTRNTSRERLDLPIDPVHPAPAAYQAERRALQRIYRDKRRNDGHVYYDATSDADLELKVERLRDEFAEQRQAFEIWQKEVLGDLTDINATVGSNHSFVLENDGVIVKTNQKEKRKLPEDIRDAIDRGIKHTNEGHFEKARVEFQSALSLAENQKHALGIVDAKQFLLLSSIMRITI